MPRAIGVALYMLLLFAIAISAINTAFILAIQLSLLLAVLLFGLWIYSNRNK